VVLVAREILGYLTEDPFRDADLTVDRLSVTWADATRRRLRASTEEGDDVALDLPRGTYLADGAVLVHQPPRVIAVRRPLEPALIVVIATESRHAMLDAALRIGHAFGNQHAPLDLHDGEIWIPLTTSEGVARATITGLHLDDVTTVCVGSVALGAARPLLGAGGESHHTAHDHGAAA